MCGLVFDHMLQTGGLDKMHKQNQDKAHLLYDAIDSSSGFYKQPVDPACRCLFHPFKVVPKPVDVSYVGFNGCVGTRTRVCMLRWSLRVRRSLMNVPFTISKGAELEAKFLKEATKAGLVSTPLHCIFCMPMISFLAFPNCTRQEEEGLVDSGLPRNKQK